MCRTEPSQSRIVATVRLTRTVSLQWLVGSVVSFFLFAYCFGAAVATIHGRALEPITIAPLSASHLTVWFVVALVAVALVVVLHELIHGFVMAVFGGFPRFGVGVSRFLLPYAYAATNGTSYSRGQLLVALLAPFVTITVVGLAASFVVSSPLLPFVLAVNAAGSVGDFWMAAVVAQYPASVRIGPLPDATTDGFAVYADEPIAERKQRPGMGALVTVCTGVVATLAALVAFGLATVLLSLAVGSGTVVIGDPDGGSLLLRHERLSTGGAAIEIGTVPVAALSILGGVGWLLASWLRRTVA